MKKKVILIAAARNLVEFGSPRIMMVPAPPLNTLALGSYLVKHDVPVELIDMQVDFGVGLNDDACHLVYGRVIEHLRAQADDIAWIGISQTASMDNGLPIAREIHTALPNIPMVFGGYLPTRVYERLLREYPFIKAVVRGDGEVAALRISEHIDWGESFLSPDVPNLAWLENEELRTSLRESVPPEVIPSMDFNLLRRPESYPLAYLMTSRGCPFHCNYCLEPVMRPYTAHSADWVAQQLDHLETVLRADRIFFIDPIFAVGRARTLEMCRIMSGHRFKYIVETRVDVLGPDLVPALREAGVEMIYFGLETVSTSTLLRMQKVRSQTIAERYVAKAYEVFESCFEHDITPQIGFMLSFPGDTEEDYDQSLHFLEQLEQVHDRVATRTGVETGYCVGAYITQVFEGSPLAAQIGGRLPHVTVTDEWAIGSTTIMASPTVPRDVTMKYKQRIEARARNTPVAQERNSFYRDFSVDGFAAAHPDMVDADGVVMFGDTLLPSELAESLRSTPL